jgi:penicillin-binding protein 1A
VGFSPSVATGVWVGFDQPRTLGERETGGRAALPIWMDYMSDALDSRPPRDFDIPEGVVFARVDSHTGRPGGELQVFLAGSEPRRVAARRSAELSARRQLLLDLF